jgi:hypothetical protein
MDHLIYVACGSRDLQIQALYAAYSALAYKRNLNLAVHVYTDEPKVFEPLATGLRVHEVSAAKRDSWRGPGDYGYRMKIAALAEAAEEYSDGRILFADADTFFIADVEAVFARIDARNAVLHRKEYPLLSHPTGQLKRFRKRMRRFRFRGNEIDLNAEMWNSGAIGLHPTQFHLLNTILAFIDVISPQYKKQLVEQYAVAYYLQKNVHVHPCDECVYHYWQQKPEYQLAIEERLAHWTGRPLEAALGEIRGKRIELPPYQPRPGWVRRLSDRLFGSEAMEST